MASFPQWSGLPHFSSVMETLFTDGTKEEAIAKEIGFCALNVLTKEKDPNRWLLLRCLHAFRRFNMYMALTLHTTKTIRKGQLATMELSKRIQEYSRKMEAETWTSEHKRSSWNFPKAHTYKHAFDDIMNKGVARNFTTKINENMHGLLKKSYQLQSNFHDFALQILHIDHCAYVASIINQCLDHYDQREALKKTSPLSPQEARAQNKSSASEPDAAEQTTEDADGLAIEDEPNEPISDEGLTMLVPAQSRSFIALEEHHQADGAFRQFCLRFQRYLPGFINDYTGKSLPPSFCFGEDEECEVLSEVYEFALVQPYNAPKGPITSAERDMGLYRVRAELRKDSIFIPVRTIIRGAVLVERYGQDFGDDDYFVMDDIDEDMFIRMQSFVY
ncbi:hypothetical protein PQX77_012354 [Marasmius sp. AFHP31]|nr:hypothetical protein PQX77_012354 [Marasmius sp. AFHP31]